MARASNDALDVLHGLLAESQTEELARNLERARKPKFIPDPANAGQKMLNPEWAPLDTKLLAVAIKFLKDNGVDAPAASPRINALVDQLRDLKIDDESLLAN